MGREKLVDQHIREYESRQRHVDELIERAHAAGGSDQLANLTGQRDALVNTLKRIKDRPMSDWEKEMINQAGPLAPVYALAEQLERLVESLER